MKLSTFFLFLATVNARVLEQCSPCDVVQLSNAALDCNTKRADDWFDRQAAPVAQSTWPGASMYSIEEGLGGWFDHDALCHDNTLLVGGLLGYARGLSPLEAAAFRGCTEFIDLLVAHGAIGGVSEIDSAILSRLGGHSSFDLRSLPNLHMRVIHKLLELRLEHFQSDRQCCDVSEFFNKNIHILRNANNENKFKDAFQGLGLLLFVADLSVAYWERMPMIAKFLGLCLRMLFVGSRMCCPVCVRIYLWCLARAPFSFMDTLLLLIIDILGNDLDGERAFCTILCRDDRDSLEWLHFGGIQRVEGFNIVARQDKNILTDPCIISKLICAGALFDCCNSVLDEKGLSRSEHTQAVLFTRRLLANLADRGGLPRMRTPRPRHSRIRRRESMSVLAEIRTDRRLVEKLKKRQINRDNFIYQSISRQLGGDVAREILALER